MDPAVERLGMEGRGKGEARALSGMLQETVVTSVSERDIRGSHCGEEPMQWFRYEFEHSPKSPCAEAWVSKVTC